MDLAQKNFGWGGLLNPLGDRAIDAASHHDWITMSSVYSAFAPNPVTSEHLTSTGGTRTSPAEPSQHCNLLEVLSLNEVLHEHKVARRVLSLACDSNPFLLEPIRASTT
ncbi:hypothetical protein LshimejAT787_1602980 [Lyophyllum shimeji]|uniref:Uncharacterized protein n=1 Tax=Lyophyllum shimeji TaxID=47721 RepID=A0A9P3PYH3_LYOSH|nr:hypothetical protein LshimejAT787_1602980 [Lyophyllum shimeji]